MLKTTFHISRMNFPAEEKMIRMKLEELAYVIANIGVIVAGDLVYLTTSNLPDMIVGTIVFLLVGIGAYRILQLSK